MSACYPCANPFIQMKFAPNGDKQNTIVSSGNWTPLADRASMCMCRQAETCEMNAEMRCDFYHGRWGGRNGVSF